MSLVYLLLLLLVIVVATVALSGSGAHWEGGAFVWLGASLYSFIPLLGLASR